MPAFITWEELQQLLEQAVDPPRLLALAEFLVEAIRNWPTYNLQEPAELVTALAHEVGNPLTHERLRQYASSLPLPEELWKVVSIGSLLHLWEQAPPPLLNRTRTLQMLLEQLTPPWRTALLS